MKKLFAVYAFMVVCSGTATAQTIRYDAASIPEALKKDASVVKRYESIEFEVVDIDRSTEKVHTIYTVLDARGKNELAFAEVTNKFSSIGDVEIKVYNSAGKQINRYRKKDLITEAYGDGLVDDGKITYLEIPPSGYPVTVEYIYETRNKASLFYPRYIIQSPGEGVEYSVFTAKVPKELDLRYKVQNYTLEPKTQEDGKYKTYTWSVNNLSPISFEEGTVSRRNLFPAVILAPTRFKMDNYEGDMSTWKSFGKWYGSLTNGIDVLPDNKKDFFREMVKNASSDKEKVQLIYDYLQKNFRYVAISLGIGGYKPFPAAFTDNKKYGDCKGLSNYMQAALDAVGIKSYQALINREPNDLPVDPAFPCNQFNHVILMVPSGTDTTWLECTSKTLDFGMLDISTENRYALVITDEGGTLVPTPLTRPDENRFTARTVIELKATGEGKTSTILTTDGEYQEMMNEVLDAKGDQQKEFLVRYWGLKQPDDFVFNNKKESSSKATSLEMVVEKIPDFIAGNKMFISPRMYKLFQGKLPTAENRKLDFYFPHPFQKSDTTVLMLPEGFVVDALPKEKQLNCKYASYISKYWVDTEKNAIYSTATLELNKYIVPASEYANVKKFFDEVLIDDTQRIVIKKN